MVGCPKNVLHVPFEDRNHTGDEHHGDSAADLHSDEPHFDQCRIESWAMHSGRDMGKKKFVFNCF